MDQYIQPLKDKGCRIWSISRLNNFNTCPRQYYLTYIEKRKQKDGIYGLLGTACHSDLENLYEGRTDKLEPTEFNTGWLKAELFGINFPVSRGDIKGNYKKDIDTFYRVYEKMEGRFISELGFVLKISELDYLIGYIDLLKLNEDGTVNIYDFKTSAMFKDKKLTEAGRQLCIYQMALEQLYKLSVVDNGWIMLKYVDIEIGNNKPKIAVQCKDMISKSESQLRALLKKNKVDESMVDLYITKCNYDNSFECLPENIKEQIKIKTHYKPYEITDDVKEETIDYINKTIQAIVNMNEKDFYAWEKNENKFFCDNLCGFGGNCD